MPLDLPDGANCFVDATIFHYALIPTFDTSPGCLSLLDRAIAGQISISSSVQVLADVLHKVMTSEAAQITGRDRGGMIGYLKRHPDAIGRCTQWPLALERIKMIPLSILDVDVPLLDDASRIAKSYGLLMNDASIVALMKRHNVTNLATNDDDFDRVPDITVWKPR